MMLDMVGSADAVRCGVVGKQAKLVLAKRLKGAAVPGLFSHGAAVLYIGSFAVLES